MNSTRKFVSDVVTRGFHQHRTKVRVFRALMSLRTRHKPIAILPLGPRPLHLQHLPSRHFGSNKTQPPLKKEKIDQMTKELEQARTLKEEAERIESEIVEEITRKSKEQANANEEEEARLSAQIQKLEKRSLTQSSLIEKREKQIKKLEEAIEEEKSSQPGSILTRAL